MRRKLGGDAGIDDPHVDIGGGGERVDAARPARNVRTMAAVTLAG